MLRKGLELFKSRDVDENIDVSVFEKEFGVKLPPKYKLFVENYDPTITLERRLENGTSLTQIEYRGYLDEDGEDISDHRGMHSLELAFKGLSYLIENDEKYSTKELLPIAWTDRHSQRGGIVVGLADHNRDQIFLDDEYWGPNSQNRFYKLADNIFEYIKDFEEFVYEDHENQLDQMILYRTDPYWKKRKV